MIDEARAAIDAIEGKVARMNRANHPQAVAARWPEMSAAITALIGIARKAVKDGGPDEGKAWWGIWLTNPTTEGMWVDLADVNVESIVSTRDRALELCGRLKEDDIARGVDDNAYEPRVIGVSPARLAEAEAERDSVIRLCYTHITTSCGGDFYRIQVDPIGDIEHEIDYDTEAEAIAAVRLFAGLPSTKEAPK